MEAKELMGKLFGDGAPYPGMEVEWELSTATEERGVYQGKITSITWCMHCGKPTFNVETAEGARFSLSAEDLRTREFSPRH